jgi:dihydropteroate synthase
MLNSRVEDINFYSKKSLNISGNLFDLTKPKVMGIINCTPDSFYSNSQKTSLNTVLQEVEKHLLAGATFIDVGGYSSRPNAKNISEKEELNRIVPVIKEIIKHFPQAIVSIDTFRANIAKTAIELGACMINDIGAFNIDENMLKVLQKYPVPYIMMHLKGNPQNMTSETNYKNLFNEISLFFSTKISILQQIGVNDIILDPGFGFAKTMEQNYELLNHLQDFQFLNKAILVGLSRKSMIYKRLKCNPEEALNGTTILNTLAVLKGAKILRVHDVKEAMEIIELIFPNK